jgi:hypothetical protein
LPQSLPAQRLTAVCDLTYTKGKCYIPLVS